MSKIVVVTPSPRVVEILKERGPRGFRGFPGGTVIVEIDEDKVLQSNETGIIFLNTDAVAALEVDFSQVDPLTAYQFVVTNALGFILLPRGTFYISGQPVTGQISSTQVGASVNAIVVSDDVIILQTFGAWEYE